MNQEFVRADYDRIAERYDDLWSRHVVAPQRRLTAELQLYRGERVLDLGCGTGVHTCEMLQAVYPGDVVGVDCSELMLQAAVQRASAAGLTFTPLCADLEMVLEAVQESAFDVISARFCLSYVNWRELLGRAARVLRPGGRIGILTNLTSSAPQAYAVLVEMQAELKLPTVDLRVPRSTGEIEEALTNAGLRVMEGWVHRFRLCFDSGAQGADWLRDSGYASDPLLERFAPEALDVLVEMFGRRLERRREREGVVLDFEVAGVVATRPTD
jgi:ubiquinone/menaquinone biosynthesis C-methylase UbiE